jgi:hypothetical protein
MTDSLVWDKGPQEPANADHVSDEWKKYKSEKQAWVKKHGDVPAVQITVFSAGEAIERDPVRYRLQA